MPTNECNTITEELTPHVQHLGAAISRRQWDEVEDAHAAIRDALRIECPCVACVDARERQRTTAGPRA